MDLIPLLQSSLFLVVPRSRAPALLNSCCTIAVFVVGCCGSEHAHPVPVCQHRQHVADPVGGTGLCCAGRADAAHRRRGETGTGGMPEGVARGGSSSEEITRTRLRNYQGMPRGLNSPVTSCRLWQCILYLTVTVPHCLQGEEEPNDTYITQLVGEYRTPEGGFVLCNRLLPSDEDGGCTTHIACCPLMLIGLEENRST